MKKNFFLNKLLYSFKSGSFFRIVYSVILKVIGVLFGLSSIFTLIRAWKLSEYLDTFGIVGLVLTEIVLIIGILSLIYIIWIRANELIGIDDKKFSILSIVAHLLKLVGEAGLIFINITGISSAISIWFSVGFINELLDTFISRLPLAAYLKYITGSGIAFGFLLILVSFFYSLFILIMFYFWSNVILGFRNIIVNIDIINGKNHKK